VSIQNLLETHGPDALHDTWPTVSEHKISRDGDDDDYYYYKRVR